MTLRDVSQTSLATTSSQFSSSAIELPAGKRKSVIGRKDSGASSSSSLVSLLLAESGKTSLSHLLLCYF
jgi:hypothetical protein